MSDSIVSKIGSKSLPQQIGILVLIGAVLYFLYYQLVYSSLGEEHMSAKQGYEELVEESRELKVKESEWQNMFKDKKSQDLKLSTNQVSLPYTAALPSFVANLQRQAAVSGVSFKNWTRKKEVVAGSYVKVPVSIQVTGSFYQILKYFYLLGKTRRIITVENFHLKPELVNSDEVLLNASFLATTFRQPDGAKQEVPKNEKSKEPKKDGKKKKSSNVDRLKNKKKVNK